MSAPYDSMSMSDAIVTLKSLPRRFNEALAGPVGDDAWERTIRTPGPSGRSALGCVGRADAELTALGTAIASIPLEKTPVVNLGPLDRKSFEPSATTEAADVLAQLGVNANRAATAIDGRGPEDFERTITMDGKSVHAHEYVRAAIATTISYLKHAQVAIENALE
jgi:sulfur carrier protein ThiS